MYNVLPPDSAGQVRSALAIVGEFGSQAGSISRARADVEGPRECIGRVISITDALQAIYRFQGIAYLFVPSAPDPCDAPSMNPLP